VPGQSTSERNEARRCRRHPRWTPAIVTEFVEGVLIRIDLVEVVGWRSPDPPVFLTGAFR
jgi:hypothetical protein